MKSKITILYPPKSILLSEFIEKYNLELVIEIADPPKYDTIRGILWKQKLYFKDHKYLYSLTRHSSINTSMLDALCRKISNKELRVGRFKHITIPTLKCDMYIENESILKESLK